MTAIRSLVSGMEQAEEVLLKNREAASKASLRTAVVAIRVALVLGLVLIGLVFALIARNLTGRRRSTEMVNDERERFSTTLTSIGDGVIVTESRS